MHKILKWVGILLSAIVILIIVAVILLMTLASPNRLKPLLTDQIKKYTGRQLTIDGDLSWTFFPYVGVKVGHIALSNPANFPDKTFAEINSATLNVKLMPLLSGKVESTGIVLRGMHLHLIKNAKGEVNWSFMQKTSNTSQVVQHTGAPKKALLGLAISGVDISDANITFSDEQTNKSYDIKQFELNAKNINLMQPFPIKTSFDFTSNNPAASGRVVLTGNTAFNLAAAVYTVRDLNFTLDLKQTDKKINMSIKGDGDFSASANSVKMQSNLSIDTLEAAKLTIKNIHMKANFQNGVLNLTPITANLYQGNLNGQATVNLKSSVPLITLHAKLANVEAEPLLQDLGDPNQKIKIAGLGNIELQIITAGTDAKTVVSNLNGTSQFSFNNGALVGIDLGYLVDTAYAVVKGKSPTAINNDKTNFGTLTGTATIKNGVIANNDLFIDGPRFATRGSGTINLVNQKMDYTLQTTVKQRDQKDDMSDLYGIALPVLVSGNLNNPSIRLDSSALGKAVAEREVKRVTTKVTEKVADQIKEKLHGKAGDVLNNLLGH